MALLSSPLQYIISTPVATKAHTILLVVLSSLYAYLNFVQKEDLTHSISSYLTLVPGNAIWQPWTFLTAGFVEVNLFEFILTIATVPASLRYLERLWGAVETIKFVGIVLIVSNLIAFFMSWLEFVILGSEELFLYGLEYRGQTALQTAVLVAFTQLMPEHQLQLFSAIKIRVKRLPMIYVTLSTALCLAGYQAPWLLIQLGWLASWFYLRFYKRTSPDTPGGVEYWGDRSETFAFVHWFPPFLHAPIGMASNVTYNLALKLKLVRPFTGYPGDMESGYSQMPGGARAEAERRRALALKALDQRLATSTSNVAPPAGLANPALNDPTTLPRPAPAAVTQQAKASKPEIDDAGGKPKNSQMN